MSVSACDFPHPSDPLFLCVPVTMCHDSSSRLGLHALSFRVSMDFSGLCRLLWSLLISHDCGGLWSGAWESQGMEQTCLPQGLQCPFRKARTASTSTFTGKLWNLLALLAVFSAMCFSPPPGPHLWSPVICLSQSSPPQTSH